MTVHAIHVASGVQPEQRTPVVAFGDETAAEPIEDEKAERQQFSKKFVILEDRSVERRQSFATRASRRGSAALLASYHAAKGRKRCNAGEFCFAAFGLGLVALVIYVVAFHG